MPWGSGKTLYRVHPRIYDSLQFNPSKLASARFSPLISAAGPVIPTLYAGTSLDCALMETVFHDVPFVAGPKMISKATHVASRVHSQLSLIRDLQMIELSPVSLRKLGISRKELIECDGSEYPDTRAWALALHDQFPAAEGLLWTSRQADPAEAIVLFEDRCKTPSMIAVGSTTDLLLSDGSAIPPVLDLAMRMDVLLTP
ncbi:RES family NAD+ phosphorylase [Acidipila sp. EB88]|uniref:RES family NAD+ phosphorylase n=1 Tax=Acidipila sp. EB88 TaxID=2305226 RepID=UPI002102822A|nr:RES family NAD+ phosphorylase [Acidipila sp. EB88]